MGLLLNICMVVNAPRAVTSRLLGVCATRLTSLSRRGVDGLIGLMSHPLKVHRLKVSRLMISCLMIKLFEI